jgi:hypothetical protein
MYSQGYCVQDVCVYVPLILPFVHVRVCESVEHRILYEATASR